MKSPRWWVLLPVALVLSVFTPALRVLPGGAWFPDPWLLLLLFAIPDPQPDDLRRCVLWVACFGLLRAAVSALSPLTCWAGLGLALAVRRETHRRLVDLHFLSRLMVGALAFLPQALLDSHGAHLVGGDLPAATLLLRAALGGLLWAAALRPARWRTAEDLRPR